MFGVLTYNNAVKITRCNNAAKNSHHSKIIVANLINELTLNWHL